MASFMPFRCGGEEDDRPTVLPLEHSKESSGCWNVVCIHERVVRIELIVGLNEIKYSKDSIFYYQNYNLLPPLVSK